MGTVTGKRDVADVKARVALDAIRGERALAEIGAKYGVHLALVANGKKAAIEGMTATFAPKRSGFCYTPTGENEADLALMRLIDPQFLETPFCGARQMARHLPRIGHEVGRKRIRRLMRRMGLAAVYQRPRTSTPHPDHPIDPYLLRDLVIEHPNEVWCAEIA
jgi:hypothetical protein